jgi:hypothetical protein
MPKWSAAAHGDFRQTGVTRHGSELKHRKGVFQQYGQCSSKPGTYACSQRPVVAAALMLYSGQDTSLPARQQDRSARFTGDKDRICVSVQIEQRAGAGLCSSCT